jgi:hypothetical protein
MTRGLAPAAEGRRSTPAGRQQTRGGHSTRTPTPLGWGCAPPPPHGAGTLPRASFLARYTSWIGGDDSASRVTVRSRVWTESATFDERRVAIGSDEDELASTT